MRLKVKLKYVLIVIPNWGLEDALAGLEGLTELQSKTKEESAEITLQFAPKTSIDKVIVAARDACSSAKTSLPKEMRDPTIERETINTDGGTPFMAITLESTTIDIPALTHYAKLNLKNVFRNIPGIAAVDIWGQEYIFEVALDLKALHQFGVNPDEVYTAIDQNRYALPVGKFQDAISTTLVQTLENKDDFAHIIVKPRNDDTPEIRLQDVATITLKSDVKKIRMSFNGQKGVIITILNKLDANPIDVSKQIYEKLKDAQTQLPKDMSLNVVLDQAEFIKASISTIQSSLFEAIILVLVIVFLFLRSFQATLIPLVTIPISLAGSLLFLTIFDYSLNLMTLLAMVLATGLVVDDAIVVLENCARHVEEGATPLEAALKGSKEIGFAIIAMTLTLCSVYAPIAFISGPIGQLFVEFSVALAGSVLISGVVALSLSPFMCSRLLKPNNTILNQQKTLKIVGAFLVRLEFNYEKTLEKALPHKKTAGVLMLIILSCVSLFLTSLPHETLPAEDRSFIGFFIAPIPGGTIDDQENLAKTAIEKIGPIKEAKNTLMFVGLWGAEICYPLVPKNQRSKSARELKEYLMARSQSIPSHDIYLSNYDSGLPNFDGTDGDELQLRLSTTDTYLHLFEFGEKIKKSLNHHPYLEDIQHDLNFNSKAYDILVNKPVAAKLRLDVNNIAQAISFFFGGDRTLRFNKDGLLYTIFITGTTKPWTLDEIYMTTPCGTRVSVGTLAELKLTSKPDTLSHYNQMRSLTLKIDPPSHIPFEKAMIELQKKVTETVPAHYKKTWVGKAQSLIHSNATMGILLMLALVFIYAVLAMQFESFLDPAIVMLTVPLAGFGALLTVWATGQSMNVYTQIGLITLIGLITKNGILIVEFANQQMRLGKNALEAVKKAAALRFRPILMTTSAMIFGAIPLILSNASGSESRQVIGAILVGGLALGTLFTLFLIPILYDFLKNQPIQQIHQYMLRNRHGR